MDNPFVTVASVFRPNIFLDVKPVGSYDAQRLVVDALLPLQAPGAKIGTKTGGKGPQGSAMIYFMTRTTAETLGQQLKGVVLGRG